MEESKEKFTWKIVYSAVLIANAVYIILFYLITTIYS